MNKTPSIFSFREIIDSQYSGDRHTAFQAGVLWRFGVIGFAICLFISGVSLLPNEMVYDRTTARFLLIVAVLSFCGLFWTMTALRDGKMALARGVSVAIMLGAIFSIVLLTGGLGGSPAGPMLIVPLVVMYSLYGLRGSLITAFAMPATLLAVQAVVQIAGATLPNFSPTLNTELNNLLILSTTAALVIMLFNAFHAENRKVSDDLEAERQHMTRLATIDDLTGLRNGRWLRSEIERHMSDSPSRPLALVYVDLDDFKAVNDAYGHAAGDAVLRTVSDRILALMDPGDVAVRTGGDEFLVLMRNVEGERQLAQRCARIKQGISGDVAVGKKTISVSGSAGAALYPVQVSDSRQLCAVADQAMYADKQRSKRMQSVEAMSQRKRLRSSNPA